MNILWYEAEGRSSEAKSEGLCWVTAAKNALTWSNKRAIDRQRGVFYEILPEAI
jgi:hypothetical protein